jgi:putative transposase
MGLAGSGGTCVPRASIAAYIGSSGLMRLRATPRRRRRPTDEGDRQIATVPSNLLDRQFAAERPNQKWIADFTYIWTAEGRLYVSSVIDLFSRRVVGRSMTAGMTAQLVASHC